MLILHIILASTLILSALVLLLAGISRNNASVVRIVTQGGLVGTFLSGSAMVFTYGGLGKFCVTMSAMTIAVVAIDRFYAYRLQPAHEAIRSDG